MARTVTLIPGDGIGPEVTAATLRVLAAAGADLEYERHIAGAEAVDRGLPPLPDELVESVRRNKVALKGPVTTPVGKGFRSVNVQLRKALELFANLRPIESLPNLPSRFEGIDLVLVRENTEGLYSGLEHEVVPGVVESLKIITEVASTRVSEFAFEFARRNGRRRITAIHKANIMKLSDGLFLECFHRVAVRYPEIRADERIVDNMAMQLVTRPEAFDMLLLENLYGDILSDLAAGLVGGLGVVPGANIGVEEAVFEAVHGSAPDIAGQDLANPMALIRSAILLLRHLEMEAEATRVDTALRRLVSEGRALTRDVGGSATTTEFTDALVGAIESGIESNIESNIESTIESKGS
jgi:isocitrate dehydrogenase (NAD+)